MPEIRDTVIEDACKTKGITSDPLRMLPKSERLNSNIVAVNGQTPPNYIIDQKTATM